jgi:hypothetical protein
LLLPPPLVVVVVVVELGVFAAMPLQDSHIQKWQTLSNDTRASRSTDEGGLRRNVIVTSSLGDELELPADATLSAVERPAALAMAAAQEIPIGKEATSPTSSSSSPSPFVITELSVATNNAHSPKVRIGAIVAASLIRGSGSGRRRRREQDPQKTNELPAALWGRCQIQFFSPTARREGQPAGKLKKRVAAFVAIAAAAAAPPPRSGGEFPSPSPRFSSSPPTCSAGPSGVLLTEFAQEWAN